MNNWSEFEKLPGGATANFESLCRSLIWLHYGRFGAFKALANQPGVEFDLHLHSDCTLGVHGQWFGWQCRWYTLASGASIGKARRLKIEEALNKTIETIPDITDWVLWTRHTLTKKDQEWFFGLHKKIHLHLWTVEEANTLLSGDAGMLKETYFGDLLLTPERLAQLHEESVAPIQKRWMPDVHQVLDAEKSIRRILCQSLSWSELVSLATRLDNVSTLLEREVKRLPNPLSTITSNFVDQLSLVSEILNEISKHLDNGDFIFLRQLLENRKKIIDRDIEAVPRRLRGARLPCGLYATNALADLKQANYLLSEVDDFLNISLVAVIADAGGGKTQLSASLTAQQGNRPAGILLLGRNMHYGQTLDDLARRIVINGKPVESMQALLAALDTAATRAKCRLPLVIDGLNEAEDPRQWKPLLTSLEKSLKQFTNVLVVCTLRTGAKRPIDHDHHGHFQDKKRLSFADQALPDETLQLEILDFADNTAKAIRGYFEYFKIKVNFADVPAQLLAHPLTLRIFCEVTNPNRKKDVGMESVPRSLASMFEQYIEQAMQRIEELSSHTNRHFRHDISGYLDIIGQQLWDNGSRELNEQELRKVIGDDRRDWNNSIVTLLEQEGILLRMPGENVGMESVIPVYDLLGGYLIANALVSRLGPTRIISWLKESATIQAFRGDYSVRHPLAQDTFRSLVALFPRRLYRQQLWQQVNEPLRSDALEQATLLEGRYIDGETVGAISNCIHNSKKSSNFFRMLFGVRSSIEHPLNADFLDMVLRNMQTGKRDLIWTEWVRENENRVLHDVQRCVNSWEKKTSVRTMADLLRAKWIMWLLTTTIHRLRDTATLALYWFGRGDAKSLFTMTETAAKINDPSVFERMMAASYGVAMALSVEPNAQSFKIEVLPRYAKSFFTMLFRENATHSTTHTLIRDYARHFLELAIFHNPALLSAEEIAKTRPPYSNSGQIEWQRARKLKKEVRGSESPFRMDFENYTLGSLVDGRGNYDYENKDYQKVRTKVLWRIFNLGWNAAKFATIDSTIANLRVSISRHDNNVNKIDRYGKKYSWIAYFELEGWLKDKGLKKDDYEDDLRTWDIDIDPSFPNPVKDYKLIDSDFLGDGNLETKDWIKNGNVPNFWPFSKQNVIRDEIGPWILLDGYCSQQDEKRGRSLFAFVRTLLVAESEKKEVISTLRKQKLLRECLPEKQVFRYTFSGENPWCETFPDYSDAELQLVTGNRKVKVKEVQETYFLDGKPVQLSLLDQLSITDIDSSSLEGSDENNLTHEELIQVEAKTKWVEVDKIENETQIFNVVMPVCDISTPGQTLYKGSTSGTTLVKYIAELLELENISQSHDLKMKDGTRATIQCVFRHDSYKNSEHFFFIREELLKQVLQKLGMALVWTVWGEREFSTEQFQLLDRDKNIPDPHYADFQAVYSYNDNFTNNS